MSDAPPTKCMPVNNNDDDDDDDEASAVEPDPPAPKKPKPCEESAPASPPVDESPNRAAPLADHDDDDDTTLFLLSDPVALSNYIAHHKSYKLPHKKSTKRLPPEIVSTRRRIQLSCRHNDLHSALETLRHAVTDSIYLEPQSLYNLLNLCEGTFGERDRTGRAHVGTPRPRETKGPDTAKTPDNTDLVDTVQEEKETNDNHERSEHHVHPSDHPTIATPAAISLHQRLRYADSIHSLLRRLNIPCTEPTFTALIRLAARAGDLSRAEAYLDEAEGTPQCKVKLRMYSALIRGYCGDYSNAEDDDEDKEDNDVVDKEDANGRGEKEANPTQQPTREDLVKALRVWIRMYRHSGGSNDSSTNNIDEDNHNEDNHNEETVLFGEGISPKINLTEIEYSSLMKCAAALRDVPVMERALSDLAERVLVPGLETTETVLRWFRRSSDGKEKSVSSAVEDVTLPPREGTSIGSVWNENGKGWRIYRRCTVDSNTGVLTLGSVEGVSSSDGNDHEPLPENTLPSFKLKPVELSDTAWEEMRRMNRAIVLEGQVEGHVSQFQGGGKGKKRLRNGDGGGNGANAPPDAQAGLNNHQQRNTRGNEWRIESWKQFETFLQNHPPYDTVIDGANVGYFQQNFANAPKHVDYKQIDWLLRHLLEGTSDDAPRRSRILLFLHERHFSPKLCPPWAFPILRAWDGDRPPYDRLTVYRTPGGMNDDWYWMHAALLYGGKGNGRPPVLAVTNDEMRDHHFQMLAQGSFLRWKERHQVHFEFGGWNKRLGRREVLLRYPNAYSRRIQRLTGDVDGNGGGHEEAIVIPLPKKGDEGRYVDGVHEADESAPVEETYVVIRKVN
ncbi:hypothetical protein ACHAW6_010985 [Cyclotella cf. meneghiniana]